MKVLIACEFSGVVRREFVKIGVDAYSCDLLPSDDQSDKHIIGNVLDILNEGWDLMIAHPPCTRLCVSGVRWLNNPPKNKTLEELWNELDESTEFFNKILMAPILKKAIENPIMHKYAKERIKNYFPYSQIIQPWQFGHGETKATCLWLNNLPLLKPTNIVEGRKSRVKNEYPGRDRWKRRSITYQGIAEAMANQWGRKS